MPRVGLVKMSLRAFSVANSDRSPYSAQVRYLAPGALGIKTATFKSNVATAPKNWSIAKSCTIPALTALVAQRADADPGFARRAAVRAEADRWMDWQLSTIAEPMPRAAQVLLKRKRPEGMTMRTLNFKQYRKDIGHRAIHRRT